MKVYPTIEVLKALLNFNPDTGIFTWKNAIGNIKQGAKAGNNTSKNGYTLIGINGYTFLAHRIAWLYMYNELPETIDHINHIRNDNRICNLRPANNLEQNRNRSKQINNTSGHTGISFSASRNRWRARIKIKGRDIHLGFHTSLDSAIEARNAAKIKYSFHKNHQ